MEHAVPARGSPFFHRKGVLERRLCRQLNISPASFLKVDFPILGNPPSESARTAERVPMKQWYSKTTRVISLSLYGGVVLLLVLWVVTAFPAKWTEFRKDEARRKELSEDVRQLKAGANELRRNQERFLTDRYFVQKLAHDIGYAHKEETIFHFDEPTSTNGVAGASRYE